MPHPGDELSALLDGELSADDAARVRTHVGWCPACAAEVGGVVQVRTWIRDLPPVEPPADFYRRVLDPGIAGASVRPRRRAGVAVMAACAAATIAILGLSAPHDHPAAPPVGRFIEAHATAAAGGDPLSQLAPVVVPVSFRR